MVLCFGCLVGYEGPDAFILSKNLPSALIDPKIIDEKLTSDLRMARVLEVKIPSLPFISSPLGLVPKHDGGFWKIHHLSYPRGDSVNDHITQEACSLSYTSLQQVFKQIIAAGRFCVLIKRDVKDAFCNILIAPPMQWLLGFLWREKYYQETCLPFGLSTAPFIFNLFAEAFHWILESYLGWTVDHYLDNFIAILPAQQATPAKLSEYNTQYVTLTDVLGIPRQESKDKTGTVVSVFGIQIDTNSFIASLPSDKITKAIEVTARALHQQSLLLKDAQKLTGYLSFCAKVVKLGWVFMRPLWTFTAEYPSTCRSTRRRLPKQVREDLIWWNTLLPRFNGVLFFDNATRPVSQLYTDASLIGLGGFTLQHPTLTWPLIPINQEDAFTAKVINTTTAYQPPISINVFEVQAILLAFKLFASRWKTHRVVVYTDSTTAYLGLKSNRLRGPPNGPLRAIMLIAAENDIFIEPQWIGSKDNALADALSRFNKETIANLCPHWQNPLSSINHLAPG